jgi:hypothetical protein
MGRKGRNINLCVRRQFGETHCAFANIELNEKERPTHVGCLGLCSDEYNLIPEHDSDGRIIHNAYIGDPYLLGGDVIWESLRSGGENGLTYSPIDGKGAMIRRAEDIHPLMHTVEDNRPYRHGVLDDEVVVEVSGNTPDIFIVAKGWAEKKTYAIQRFVPCIPGMYGKFDKYAGMVLPKCTRDYSGEIKDWLVITHPMNRKPKDLYLCDDPIDKVKKHCLIWFKDITIAKRVYGVLKAIRKGEYINLSEALQNNGLTKLQAQKFMTGISVKSKRSIYSRINLTWYRKYYELLGSDKLELSEESVLKLRRNMINYIVNYPKFQKVLAKTEFGTDERYWDLYLLIKRACKQRVITKEMRNSFPEWLNKIIVTAANAEKSFKLFDQEHSLKTASKDLKEDFLDAIIDKVPRGEPQRLYPAMEIVREVINAPYGEAYTAFADIVKAGKYWSKPELRGTWKVFQRAYESKRTRVFWNFIESVIELDRESATRILDDDLGGEISVGRIFAENLISLRHNKSSFDVRDHKPDAKWTILVSKLQGSKGMYAKDIAWNALLTMGGLSKDKVDTEEECAEAELVLHGTEIDTEDLYDLTIISGEVEE